ncbi:hypothetical protein [Geodermatophilus sp. FMUSA9-8]|uniref:hypothetical protein n=1 Tax=Geodermatophilus sp. FMUSA9-8 TaxID=3120155 RepID=UPI0030083F4D
MSALLDDLADLGPVPAIHDLATALTSRVEVISKWTGPYVSLRPANGGAVACYLHKTWVSIALPAEDAKAVLVAVPGATLDEKSPRTAYLHASATVLAEHAELVRLIAEQSLAWRAGGHLTHVWSTHLDQLPVRPVEPDAARAAPRRVTSEPVPSEAAAVALRVARCIQLPLAQRDPAHPCSKVVGVQAAAGPARHLPEPWAGDIERARILFLSSNPSLSESGDHQSGTHVERYPLAEWKDDDIVDFFLHRFGTAPNSPATPDGHFRNVLGELSPKKVAFWVNVRKRAQELLGPGATPERDYCMTEVVHCKSKKEIGVDRAVNFCARMHLDRVVGLSQAPLVVVLGAKARKRVMSLWGLPAAFGTAASLADDPRQSLAVRTLGGSPRLVAFLPHPVGMAKNKTFAKAYLAHGLDLGAVARGGVAPEELLDT